ncbi:MAG: hypothetical protein MJ171_03435 [Clostridia bacterium]|nr:hypothetical protein [Clostridia bacterium]
MERYSKIANMDVTFKFTVALDDENGCYRFFAKEEDGKSLHIASIPAKDENGRERELYEMAEYLKHSYKLLLLHYIDFTSGDDYKVDEEEEEENCESCGACSSCDSCGQ